MQGEIFPVSSIEPLFNFLSLINNPINLQCKNYTMQHVAANYQYYPFTKVIDTHNLSTFDDFPYSREVLKQKFYKVTAKFVDCRITLITNEKGHTGTCSSAGFKKHRHAKRARVIFLWAFVKLFTVMIWLNVQYDLQTMLPR